MPDSLSRVVGYRAAVAEGRSFELQRRDATLTTSALFVIFKSKRVADPGYVRSDVADNQKTTAVP
jgi:hypothetical protein